jgi:lipopolysaccharide/colanic/teichoic acid biosynthesis glycosyltransferase
MASTHPSTRPYDVVKRVIDVVMASVGLVLTAPVQAVLASLVARKLGRPVLFRQQRPGRFGEPFTLVKFRTMREPDPETGLLTDADRLTPFGSVLRSASLDELPTLWNVLCGDMSLVGPRPLLTQYLPRYTPQQARRHEVRPGITGLAQVSGRNAISWNQKFAADVDYVNRRSLSLDLGIIARTMISMVRRDGISASGDVTMPEFMGSTTTDQPT